MSLEQRIYEARTDEERIRIAYEGIRRIIDDTFIPLIIEKREKLTDYGDICFALGYLGASTKS